MPGSVPAPGGRVGPVVDANGPRIHDEELVAAFESLIDPADQGRSDVAVAVDVEVDPRPDPGVAGATATRSAIS